MQKLREHLKREGQHLYANLQQRLASLNRQIEEPEADKAAAKSQAEKTRLSLHHLEKYEPRIVGDGVTCFWCAQFGREGIVREIGSDVRGINRYRCDTCETTWPFPAGRP